MHDAAGCLCVGEGSSNKKRTYREREGAVAVEPEGAPPPAVGTACLGLVAVDYLDGLYFGRAGHGPCGEIACERREHVLVGLDSTGYLARNVLHMAEFLHAHNVADAHAAELCHLANVVAVQVDIGK